MTEKFDGVVPSDKYKEKRKDRRSTLTIQPYNDLVICVPCYNEEKRLNVASFEKFLNKYTDIQLVFINDGSTDDTLSTLISFTERYKRQTHLINLEKNVGKAEAVRIGLKFCLDLDKKYIGYWDADLATDLSAIPDFARILRSTAHIDVVMGARLKLMGHDVKRDFSRVIVSKMCNVLAKIALRQNFRDTQCGAKVLRVTTELKAAIERPFTTPWLFDVELFKRLKLNKDAKNMFYEYPLPKWTEIDGSNIRLSTIFHSGLSMMRLVFSR